MRSQLFHYPQGREIKMKYCTFLSLCISFTFDKRGQGRPSFIIRSFSALLLVKSGIHGGAVGWFTALQAWRSRIRFPVGLLGCLIVLILPASLWRWDRLILWQKWVPGVSPGGTGDRCVGRQACNFYVLVLKTWESQRPRAVRDFFTFTFYFLLRMASLVKSWITHLSILHTFLCIKEKNKTINEEGRTVLYTGCPTS